MTIIDDTIIFEPHGHGVKSEGRIDGISVVAITKNKTHTHTNSGIYTVHVLGEALNQSFREIKEARDAARLAFAARAGSTLTDEAITSTMNAIGPRPFHTGHFIESLGATRPELWKALVARYGEGGHGAGKHYSAFSAVAHTLHRAASRGVLDKLEDYFPAPPALNWGSPVIRYWTGPGGFSDQPYPDEPPPEETYPEGAVVEVTVTREAKAPARPALAITVPFVRDATWTSQSATGNAGGTSCMFIICFR